jgi:CheY-like chemotaxis protein
MGVLLIVEDDPALGPLLVDLAVAIGAATQLCLTAREAIEAMDEMPVQAAVVDLGLPDLPGTMVLDALARRQIPALAISGSFSGQRLQDHAVKDHGAHSALEKPFAGDTFQELLGPLLAAWKPPDDAAVSDVDFAAEAKTAALLLTPALGTMAVDRAGMPTAPPPARKQPGVSKLPEQGDLATFPVARLLALLHRGRGAGELRLKRGQVQKRLWLDAGELVFAASNLVKERFGRFAAQQVGLRPEDLDAILELAEQASSRTSDAMVRVGLLTETQRVELLQDQARHLLWSTFDWTDGEFVFEPGPPRKTDRSLGLPLGPLLWRGYMRLPLMALRERLRDADKLAPVAQPDFDTFELGLPPAELELVRSADGSKTTEDLLALTTLDEREARAILVALVVSGQLAPRVAPRSDRRIVMI